MNLFAISAVVLGVVLFVVSSYILFKGAEITFKGNTGAGIVSLVIACVIWYIREWVVYWWITIIAIAYFIIGIALIFIEFRSIRQWPTTRGLEIKKREEIIQLNDKAKCSLVLALSGVICFVISTKV